MEKEFNTLEAQREAGVNYVKSQIHQGWTVLPEHYDDGGFSGGNINRPALKRLMEDVKKNKVDMIVVYKIDRLTRSLMDFSKLIEILDKHKCSFVSVTQNFNTYDSMGRLTLNVLLSFVQFEREVGAERIRDKIAASRQKGMWMGGTVPIGYDVQNKKLIINQQEADMVRLIFDKYCQCKSEREVCQFINKAGYRAKERKYRTSDEVKSRLFTHAKISYLLRNPLYKGKVVHKGKIYDGQHEAIISEDIWDKVQAIKLRNREDLSKPSKVIHNSLLKGLIECGRCHASMISTRTKKKNKTYEYYTSIKAVKEGYEFCSLGSVPAGELDCFVISKIQDIFKSPKFIDEIAKQINKEMPDIGITEVFKKVQDPTHFFDFLSRDTVRAILHRIVSRIVVYHDKLVIRLMPFGAMLLETAKIKELHPYADHPELMELQYNICLAKKRGQLKILPPDEEKHTVDDTLLNSLVRAFRWHQEIESGKCSARELSLKEKLDRSYMARVMKLTYLAPDIIEAIMLGTQPKSLKISDIIKHPIPVSWQKQRELYGFITS